MSGGRRLAIVNRGDAANRLLAAARELNHEHGGRYTTVALFTEPDRDAAFVTGADEAYCLGPAMREDETGSLVSGYLHLPTLRRALRETGSELAWPGWGFVSEREEFARLCEELGVRMVGPPADVIARLGDKVEAKRLAEGAGVPVAPWARIERGSDVAAIAEEIGFPLLVKAAAGGGGRGIRRVGGPEELEPMLESAAREAEAAFGDGTVFLEREVTPARHLEVQIAADRTGKVWALGVRECSVQRRRQKMIEETAPIPSEVSARLAAGAMRIASAAGYVGLGTVEFLCDRDGAISFMEVNARLQVEHTVTEATTGVDLVKLGLALADGEELRGDPPRPRGHAVEARITATDPQHGFRAAPGRIAAFRSAAGPGVRVDSGVAEGGSVPTEFDPMLVKTIAWGATRREAIARLRRALEDTDLVIAGGATDTGFLLRLLAEPEFERSEVDTLWVERLLERGPAISGDQGRLALIIGAVELAERERRAQVAGLLSTAARGRPVLDLDQRGVEVELAVPEARHSFLVQRVAPDRFVVEGPPGAVEFTFRRLGPTARELSWEGARIRSDVIVRGAGVQVVIGGTTYTADSEQAGLLRAPSPSVVIGVRVSVGDEVAEGDPLLVLESMKMESTLTAPSSGVVREVHVRANQQVDAGAALLTVDPGEGSAPSSGPAREESADSWGVPAAIPASEVEAALRRLRGFDPGPTGASEGDVPPTEVAVELLERFAECSRISSPGRGSSAIGGTAPSSPRERLLAFMKAPERSREILTAPEAAELESALERFGAAGLDPGEELDEAIFRLWRAQASLGEIESVADVALRRWEPGEDAGERALDLLDRLGEACEVAFPALSDAAQAALHRLARSDSGTEVPEGAGPGRATIDDATADRLELWRFREFELDALESTERLHLLSLVAHENAADHRLIVVGELADEPNDAAAQLESAMNEGLALIRARQVAIPAAERPLTNRIVLYARGPWAVSSDAVKEVWHRLARRSRNLGIDKVLVRVRGDRARLVHMTAPADTGVSLGETAPSDAPLRPLDKRRQRILKLRRRGLRDPYEIADLITSRNAKASDFPPGRFEELDLDGDGDLAPVARLHGENSAGVVVGVVENATDKHPEGIRRMLLLGDPSKGLGALAEGECRRIIAAIDRAEREGIPLEWFAVSAGARIAMDSGTENMDWVARVLRRIVAFTQAGGELNIVVAGVNVGAQPYFNAEATMLMHTRGILVMTPGSSMLLTGKEALDFAGGVSAEDNFGIGGYERVMGPNGQAQYWAPTLEAACEILFRHYEHTYVAPGELFPRRRRSDDPEDRDVRDAPHPDPDSIGFQRVGDVFSQELNPDRKKPFDMRAVMRSLIDSESDPLERWAGMAGAEGAIVWDAHLGGFPVALIGIESRPLPRDGIVPADGPTTWNAATLFPRSSKKVARALNAASGNRPAIVLANLAGFDGSPESLRELQLEYGAEIGRAMTNFEGPIQLCVVSRYHGGAFVVFSKALNDELSVLAVEGSRASVIGGSAAAAVVFGREVAKRAAADERIRALDARLAGVSGAERLELAAQRRELLEQVRDEVRGAIAVDFDAVHTIERARDVGSVDRIIAAAELRPQLIAGISSAIERRTRNRDAGALNI